MKGNFFKLPNSIYDQGLTTSEICVYGYLIRCADKSKRCYPSRETIGKKCGIKSLVTVDKNLKSLEDRGFIEKTKRRNYLGNSYLSNIYTINDI